MSFGIGVAGLGRIGRGLLRTNFAQQFGGRFDIRVICDVMPIDQIAYLLCHDSTYGKFPCSIECEKEYLVLDGKRIRYERVDRRRSRSDDANFRVLSEYGLDVFVDATGTATIDDFRSLIRQGVAAKTLSTWNVEGCDLSVVYGVNDNAYDPALHHIVTASTCTGNALAPVLLPLLTHIGIDYARIVTIHPVLSDQRALDGYHASSQLGRSYRDSIVPTTTNVAKSTALVLPSLEGKLDSLSYRIPTAIVSAMDVNVTLSRQTSRDECVELLERYANTVLADIIHCDYGAWGHQRASIDYQGSIYSSHVLMKHLVVSHGRQLGLSLMHDNEWAYCCRVLDVLGLMSKGNTALEQGVCVAENTD